MSGTAYRRLNERGVFRADGRKISHARRPAYHWMIEQMRIRIGPSGGAHYPVWAWRSWNGRPRPDLRSGALLSPGMSGWLVDLELPGESVLLSDFDAWHAVLKRGLLALCPEEEEAFDAALIRAGQPLNWPFPPMQEAVVVDSWQRIFDLDGVATGYSVGRQARTIQATFWELPLNAVRSAKPFVAR
jgi:Domain of unknown function (DUF3841)